MFVIVAKYIVIFFTKNVCSKISSLEMYVLPNPHNVSIGMFLSTDTFWMSLVRTEQTADGIWYWVRDGRNASAKYTGEWGTKQPSYGDLTKALSGNLRTTIGMAVASSINNLRYVCELWD